MLKIQQLTKKDVSINGDGTLKNVSLSYLVTGTNDHMVALREVRNHAPEYYETFVIKEFKVNNYESNIIEVGVVYAEPDNVKWQEKEEEEPTLSFDCSTGSMHITHGLSERVIKGVPAGNAIGWNGKYGDDMEITGVDIPIAQMQENYTKIIRLSKLTNVYKRKIASLVGKVNSKAFKGWEPGEVMFMGCSYSTPDKNSAKVTVTFNFTIQPNETDVLVGGEKVTKKGWEHVWAISRTIANDGATPQIETDGVYVNQVVEYADFGVLEL